MTAGAVIDLRDGGDLRGRQRSGVVVLSGSAADLILDALHLAGLDIARSIERSHPAVSALLEAASYSLDEVIAALRLAALDTPGPLPPVDAAGPRSAADSLVPLLAVAARVASHLADEAAAEGSPDAPDWIDAMHCIHRAMAALVHGPQGLPVPGAV